MSAVNVVFIAACAVLVVVPVAFVVHKVYQDGLVGRIGLLGISFSAFVSIGESIARSDFNVPPVVVMMIAAAALFLCWHLFRFHRRVLRGDTYTIDASGSDRAGYARLSAFIAEQGAALERARRDDK